MVLTLHRAAVLTAEEFLAADHVGWELVHGVPEELGVGVESSWFGGEIHGLIREFTRKTDSGSVFPQDSAISVWPGDANHIRKPDVFFIRKERISPGFRESGFVTVVPDLVVEVVSPNDEAGRLAVKVRDYREAGVPYLWVIFPETRAAMVYEAGQPVTESSDSLSAERVLPGFTLSLPDLFARADAELGERTTGYD